MNEQIKRPSTSTQSDMPPKRGRGRPRRDDTIPKNQQLSQFTADPNYSIDNNMVGKVVYGVIEGSFDSGYLISVKNDENNILMRGVVFHPQMVNPLNRENDVALNAKMFERKEVPIPVFGSQIEANNKSLMGVNGLEEKLKYEIGTKSSGDTTLPVISSTKFEGKNIENIVKNVPIVKGFEVGVEKMTKKDEVMQENEDLGDANMTKKDKVIRENEDLIDAETTKEDEVMQENEDTTTLVHKPRFNDNELVDEEHVEVQFDNGNEKQMMQVNELQTGKSVTESEPETKETTRDLAPLIQ